LRPVVARRAKKRENPSSGGHYDQIKSSFRTAWVTGGRQTMSAATAAFLGSGRRVRATVVPPSTVNPACNWWRNLLQLRTMAPATVASATGQFRPLRTPLSEASEIGITCNRELLTGRAEVL
jgi:hypothetical protein